MTNTANCYSRYIILFCYIFHENPRKPRKKWCVSPAITENLRDAVCDQMSNRSAGTSCADVCQSAGDESLLGRSTVIDIVHQEGEQLVVAQRERARAVLDEASEA